MLNVKKEEEKQKNEFKEEKEGEGVEDEIK